MPKSSQKPAGAEQPANQRGKSRFGISARPARVVLPERPPRAVDNEIVSILLGADPALLAEQAADAAKTPQPNQVEAAPPSSPTLEESQVEPTFESVHPPDASAVPFDETEAILRDQEVGAAPVTATSGVSETLEIEGFTLGANESAPARIPSPVKPVAPAPARRRQLAAARRTGGALLSAAQVAAAQESPISSFEEFAERWRHGLRKGQLKICEVLYQKTYAIGQTECVTSFAELGRLSGLKMRQCFNVIAQLEALKFVERSRSTDTSNKKDQGSVIRFHLFPAQ